MPADKPGVFQKSAEAYEPRGRLDPAGFERHVRFRTVPPRGRLEVYLDHFWVIRWDVDEAFDSVEVMHRPYVDIFLGRELSGIQGTFRGKRVYTASGGHGRIVGARFRPGAFRAFWNGQLSNLQDRILPLDQVFAGFDQTGVERLLDGDDAAAIAGLAALLRACDPPDDENIVRVNAIIAAIEADENLTTVSRVASEFARSERWVQQLFRNYLGIGLKWFLQRRRLLAAAELIRTSTTPDWIGMAYDLGYSSQQHFITDFRQVLGETPLQYKARLRQGG